MRKTLIALATLFTACGPATGKLKVLMTDAPVDGNIKNVFVTYDELRVHNSASTEKPADGSDAASEGVDGKGWMVLCKDTRTVDLLELQNGAFTPVCARPAADGGTEDGVVTVPAGKISQLRLHVTSARLTFKDGQADQTLTIPSASRSGLKINVHGEVPANGVLELKIDFDAGESLHKTGNNTWSMKPVLKVVN